MKNLFSISRKTIIIILSFLLFITLFQTKNTVYAASPTENLRISAVINNTNNMTISNIDGIVYKDEIIVYGSFRLEVQQGEFDWQTDDFLDQRNKIQKVTLYEQIDGGSFYPVYNLDLKRTMVGYIDNVWGSSVLIKVGQWDKTHRYYFEGQTMSGETVRSKVTEILVRKPAAYSAILGDMDLYDSMYNPTSYYTKQDIVRFYSSDGTLLNNVLFDKNSTSPTIIVDGEEHTLTIYEVPDMNMSTIYVNLHKNSGNKNNYIMLVRGHNSIGEEYTETFLPNNSGGGGISVQQDEPNGLTGIDKLSLTSRVLYLGNSSSRNKDIKFLVGTWEGQYRGINGMNYVSEVKELSKLYTDLAKNTVPTQGVATGYLSLFDNTKQYFTPNVSNSLTTSLFSTETNGFLKYGSTAHALISNKGGLINPTDRNRKPIRIKIVETDELNRLVRLQNLTAPNGTPITTFDELQLYVFDDIYYAEKAAYIAQNANWAQGFMIDYVTINISEKIDLSSMLLDTYFSNYVAPNSHCALFYNIDTNKKSDVIVNVDLNNLTPPNDINWTPFIYEKLFYAKVFSDGVVIDDSHVTYTELKDNKTVVTLKELEPNHQYVLKLYISNKINPNSNDATMPNYLKYFVKANHQMKTKAYFIAWEEYLDENNQLVSYLDTTQQVKVDLLSDITYFEFPKIQ